MSHKMNLYNPSSQKGSSKKKGNKSYAYDTKQRENIIRKLYDSFQDHFDLALIASVAHTCQWDIQKATEVLVILSGRKESKKNKNSKASDRPKNKAKSLPGTLKSEKSGSGKGLESSTSAHHSSTNSLASGQVWQRHYKSKPQSPGLLTMIPPHSKEIVKLKPPISSKPTPKTIDPHVKNASIIVKKIQKSVQNGIKVMILMRGVPGSGKTHLAQVVVSLVTRNDLSQHILSTDDYFIMLGRGNYAYDYNQLPQAHNWNQKRVLESLKRGINPVVVDNTNTQAWEMQPYVIMAMEHGYTVEVLEPVTEWRNKEAELAKRNVHSIPREKIRQMLERFEPGWTGEKLMQWVSRQRFKTSEGTTPTPQEVKRPTSTLLAQHREHAAINAPEKPKRKKNGAKKKDRHQLAGVEITEDKEKQLEELNKLFAEYGKTIDPVSKQKVLESGVPIPEVVSRMRKLQGNILPLPKPNAPSTATKLENNSFNDVIKPVPSYSTLLRGSMSEHDQISSSNASETSECETDTDAELPKWKDVKRYFHGTSGYFVDGEDMLEDDDDDDEGKSEGAAAGKSSKSHTPCSQDLASLIDYDTSTTRTSFSQEEPPLIDFDIAHTPASFSQDDLSLLNYDDTGNTTSRRSSSSSEEQETQMLSLQNSLREVLLENSRRNYDVTSDSALTKSDNSGERRNSLTEDRPAGGQLESLSDSLLNVLGRRFDNNQENPSRYKAETESVQGGVSINESLLQMLVKKYSTDEVENSEMEIGNTQENQEVDSFECVKSPDLEEVPLPCIPPEGEDAPPKPKYDTVSEASKHADYKCDMFEDIVSSWNHTDHIPTPDSNIDALPKEQRSKGAIKKTGINIRDKSPDELLRSVDLSWSSVPFTSSWEDVSKKSVEPETQNLPKPQRRSASKSDSSTNTQHADFDLWKKDEGVVKLIARNRNINQENKESLKPVRYKSDILMLDKGSMTLDAEDLDTVGKENALDTLSGMFPDITQDHVLDILDKCKGNLLWAIEVLLETPQNLAEISTKVMPEDNPPPYGEAKALEDSDYISLQNVMISDGKKTIKRRKEKKATNSELSQILKKQIEESIQINEDFYQDKTLFLKKLRHGEIQLDDVPLETPSANTGVDNVAEKLRESAESEDDDEEETIPMKLDPEFFRLFTQQLGSSDECADDKTSDFFCPIINVPMSLAQQIYDCWIENINKQLEDMQNNYDRLALDDELLASAFQEQEFEYRQPDLREIMDMELAMLMYKQNQAHMHDNFRETMATKLSKQLLFEAYPNLDKKMLLDLFESEGRSFQKTVDVLSAQENQSPITVVAPEFLAAHGKKLLEQVKSEDLKKNLEKMKKPVIIVKPKSNKKDETLTGKDVLLINPVEYRHKTAQLHQQRNECCRLAQEAFRKKSYSIASYFSRIAGLYKDRIKELSKEPFPPTLFDEKIGKDMKKIDLHFLLVSEALQILDMFLDYHIKDLRRRMTLSASLDLITGRGQHSIKGKSRIKPAVMKRLEYRQLSFISINPGMLRVTIHKNDLLLAEM